jgi:hypothetical protein
MQDLIDAPDYFVMFHEISALGRRYAHFHASGKLRLSLQHAIDCILHKLLGILAVARSHLLQTSLNVSREIDLHAPKPKHTSTRCQARLAPRLAPTLIAHPEPRFPIEPNGCSVVAAALDAANMSLVNNC